MKTLKITGRLACALLICMLMMGAAPRMEGHNARAAVLSAGSSGEMAEGGSENGAPIPAAPFALIAVAVVIVGRSLRVSRKYRKRYGKGYVYKRKDFTRSYREENERDYD